MSRTNKTKPASVLAMQTNDFREYHNHDNSECDLPPLPRKCGDVGWSSDTNCYWSFSDTFWYTRTMCGCHMCTMHDERRAERRKHRHDAKRALHEVMKYGNVA